MPKLQTLTPLVRTANTNTTPRSPGAKARPGDGWVPVIAQKSPVTNAAIAWSALPLMEMVAGPML